MGGKWFYIQWHNDTHNRPQMQDIIMDCGWESYGIYVALTEILHKNGGVLPLFSLKSVAWSLHISTDRLREFVERFIAAGIMDADNENLTSVEIQQQLSKQTRAIAAANIRWENARKQIPEEHKAELPPVEHTEQTELSDTQKQSIELLTDKLKYTQDRAETIAKEYDYDYITEKYNYMIAMIKKGTNIKSPHSYFEKALKENWVSSDDIFVKEETTQPTTNISYSDVLANKFITDYKSLTHTDFPKDKIDDLKSAIDDKESNIEMVLSIITKYVGNNDFWNNTELNKKEVLDCSIFFDRQKSRKVIEYGMNNNIFKGSTMDDIISVLGGYCGK
jgi:hypothetical protein